MCDVADNAKKNSAGGVRGRNYALRRRINIASAGRSLLDTLKKQIFFNITMEVMESQGEIGHSWFFLRDFTEKKRSPWFYPFI